MTQNLRPPPSEWRFENVSTFIGEHGIANVTFRQGRGGPTYFMSPEAAEDAAKRLLEAARQAKAAMHHRDDPEGG